MNTEPEQPEMTNDAVGDDWPWPHYPKGAKRNWVRPRNTPLTGWEGDFLQTFMDTGNLRYSASVARVGYNTVGRRRQDDPQFREAYALAKEMAVQTLEAAAWKRARDGIKRVKPIMYRGEKVGEEVVTEYSDTLMLALLRAHAPETYRETVDHNYNMRFLEAEAERIAQETGLDKERIMAETQRILEEGKRGGRG